jgi:hypothetical protein
VLSQSQNRGSRTTSAPKRALGGRPAWILLGWSPSPDGGSVHYFPQAFSIVALDITMTRERALAAALAIVTRDRMGLADFRQAASFAFDSDA